MAKKKKQQTTQINDLAVEQVKEDVVEVVSEVQVIPEVPVVKAVITKRDYGNNSILVKGVVGKATLKNIVTKETVDIEEDGVYTSQDDGFVHNVVIV